MAPPTLPQFVDVPKDQAPGGGATSLGPQPTASALHSGAAADYVVYTSDGATLVSASEQGGVTLWDVATHKPRSVLVHSGKIDALAASPDGRLLAVVQQNSSDSPRPGERDPAGASICLWDVPSGRRVATLSGVEGPLHRIMFTSEGNELLSIGEQSGLVVWNLDSHGQSMSKTFNLPKRDYPYAMALDPSNKTVALGMDSGVLYVLSVETLEPIATMKGHEDRIEWVCFSPDRKSIATASRDATARIWQAPDAGKK